ncbi:phosphoribosylpyrophosphate synthetase [Flavihumibacter sp. R14]|nr:phosphoribosylpyrophosphate synthetase [Flavihumibacter soli]
MSANEFEYESLVEALNALKEKGFTHDFNIHNSALHSSEGNITLSPKDFEIVKVYRFEGMSDPGDNSILYAIDCPKHNVKGTFINAYGVYSDEISEELLKKLNTPVPN